MKIKIRSNIYFKTVAREVEREERQMYFDFVDEVKAFDRVPRKVVR